MSFEIIVSKPFERKFKRLAKKHKFLKNDLSALVDSLEENPGGQGIPLGKDCYKICMAVASKGRGKSGDARVVTCVRIVKETVYLMDIFDKSERDSISDKELRILIELVFEE